MSDYSEAEGTDACSSFSLIVLQFIRRNFVRSAVAGKIRFCSMFLSWWIIHLSGSL